MLQVAFTLLFYFFISYDTLQVDQKLLVTYQGEEPGEMVRWARGRGCLGLPNGTGAPFYSIPQKGVPAFTLIVPRPANSVDWALGVVQALSLPGAPPGFVGTEQGTCLSTVLNSLCKWCL